MSNYTVEKNKLVQDAVKIIARSEGKYNSVVKNDNGACSIGMMQWHGDRALRLLQKIANETTKVKLVTSLGPVLSLEILNNKTSWSKRSLNSIEKDMISKFLDTPTSKQVQDKLASEDISFYVNKIIQMGITNSGIILYLADALHQYGMGSKLWTTVINDLRKSKDMSLESLHNMVINNSVLGKYKIRRYRVYKEILTLPYMKYDVKN